MDSGETYKPISKKSPKNVHIQLKILEYWITLYVQDLKNTDLKNSRHEKTQECIWKYYFYEHFKKKDTESDKNHGIRK